MGMNAVRVTEPNELADVLKASYRRAGGPLLIDVEVDGTV
jgi:thiamine pyrophosphate-dependent acetolactate synthase large subunit-like protein